MRMNVERSPVHGQLNYCCLTFIATTVANQSFNLGSEGSISPFHYHKSDSGGVSEIPKLRFLPHLSCKKSYVRLIVRSVQFWRIWCKL